MRIETKIIILTLWNWLSWSKQNNKEKKWETIGDEKTNRDPKIKLKKELRETLLLLLLLLHKHTNKTTKKVIWFLPHILIKD